MDTTIERQSRDNRAVEGKRGGTMSFLVGRKIKEFRRMKDSEMRATGLKHRPMVIVTDLGTVIYPGKDDDGQYSLFARYEKSNRKDNGFDLNTTLAEGG